MKRIAVVMALVLLLQTVLMSQTITCKFDGPVSFEKVFLYQYKLLTNKFVSVDSTMIVDRKFRFDFTAVEEPTVSTLRFVDKEGKFVWGKELEIFLSRDSILILASDSFRNARVLNSATNYEYAFFNEMIQPALLHYYSIDREISKDVKAIPYDIAVSKEFGRFASMRRKQSRKGLHSVYEDFMRAHPASWVSLYAMRKRLYDMDIEVALANELYSILDQKLKQSPAGIEIAARLEKLDKLQIGLAAPAIKLPNVKGKMIDLNDYRSKYVLLEFWSSGCGACRIESPHLIAAFDKYKQKGFDILSISLDEDKYNGRERWLKAIEKDGTNLWQQVSDLKGYKSTVAINYDIHSIPQNFLVDPQGKIIAKNLRGADLHKKLEELFGL